MIEARYGVWLSGTRVGMLLQRGDYVRLELAESYLDDPWRPVLGLAIEDNIEAPRASALRLPPWFSNLLPEGQLRDWVADERGVSADREMELLAQLGLDLPGAVQILIEDPDVAVEPPDEINEAVNLAEDIASDADDGWRFSLAGVGLKFSMIQEDQRLTLPAHGEGGDWIVKLPDAIYEGVPANEYAMMTLASAAGINVPALRLVHRDSISNLPSRAWLSHETFAYAVKRFDRVNGGRIHIEDFAQVREVYPHGRGKYQGNFETVASIAYRQHDLESLREFVRRLTLNVLISNGDAHLKNWSLIYNDARVPTLSPAYDVVATRYYADRHDADDLGLRFHGSRRFEDARIHHFGYLGSRLGVPGDELMDVSRGVVEAVGKSWPDVEGHLSSYDPLRTTVRETIKERTRSFLGPRAHSTD